jgi:hypothetical protein
LKQKQAAVTTMDQLEAHAAEFVVAPAMIE